MKYERGSGILMHITSLPGKYGIGDFGSDAYQFIDFLSKAKQSYWQMLPLTPTNSSHSPYESLSAFAGNPLLINPDKLYQIGHLTKTDLDNLPEFPENKVHFNTVIRYKSRLLEKAYKNFKKNKPSAQNDYFINFCNNHHYWLDDFSLYISIKKLHRNVSWTAWDREIVTRKSESLEKFRKKCSDEIEFQKYQQWQFYSQLNELKRYANEKGIKIIGDIPIFISLDSADVWANQDIFYLDENFKPTVVSGVPPDYFSSTGQKWGHPLYRWDLMALNRYDWWTKRFQIELLKGDILRIDHFRAFYNYWEIKADQENAVNGRWLPGPGADFFHTIISRLGDLNIIAEDLGEFDQQSRIGVDHLKDQFGFPGMTILQFAFSSDPKNLFLPHNYLFKNLIVYTGTHDNDTILGWYQETSTKKEREYALKYLKTGGKEISWDLIRLAWSSNAIIAITTTQDLLELGHKSRMNTPSTLDKSNWSWRLSPGKLNDTIALRLKELTEIYGRNF
jgi:4-alpha-glucanotransferase